MSDANGIPLPKPGGWTIPGELKERDKEVFERAMQNGPIGVKYEPYEVATQVVAGTNYCFSCNATALSPEAEPKKVYIYIFEALLCNGGDVKITSIIDQ